MRVLFCHTNFPGQFGGFGAWLAERGWDVMFATGREGAQPPTGTRLFRFTHHKSGAPETHRHARPLDQALKTAESFAAAAIRGRAQGFAPDVIVAHSGWGAGTYAKAVWPEARFVSYAEWWYNWPRVDVHPDDPPPSDPTAVAAKALARNAPMLLDLAAADAVLVPTHFQAAQFPGWLRPRISVLHDGVDTAGFAPDPDARDALAASLGLPAEAEILSYATRGMEPYRGFPEFMRALARLQAERPRLHAVIAGEDRVAYGEPLPEGESWKQRLLAELPLDTARVHFTGLLPPLDYRRLLQGTDVHVYLTLPFVLSWSMIEAMSTGCRLVVSDVDPVTEALGHDAVALKVSHYAPEALARTIATALDDLDAGRRRGLAARRRAQLAYGRDWLWPARADLIAGPSLAPG